MSQQTRLKKALYWLLFMLCFAALPGMLIVFGFVYASSQSQQNQLNEHATKIGGLYQNLQQFANSEAFYCSYLNLAFNQTAIKKKNARQQIEQKLAEVKRKLNLSYVLYQESVGIATSSFVIDNLNEWATGMNLLMKFCRRGSAEASEEELLIGSRIFGPQLNLNTIDRGSHPEDPQLAFPDSTFVKPMLWTVTIRNFQVLLRIDPANLESSDGVWNRVEEFSLEANNICQFSIVDKSGFRHPEIPEELRSQVEKAFHQHEKEKLTQVKTQDLIVFPKFINHRITLLGYVRRTSLKADHLLLPALLISLIFLVFIVVVGRYSYFLIVRDQPDNLSLRWKLRFLFFFANGLPLIVLFFIGTDYLDQKRGNLLREMHGKGTQFVQDFDEKIEIEYAKAVASKKAAEKGLVESLSERALDAEILKTFVDGLSKNAQWRVLLIASQSRLVGTEHGMVGDKKSDSDDSESGSQNLRQREYTRKIGQFFLNKLNGAKVSDKDATEIEMLLESVTQKPLVNFIFEMLRNRGHFIDWGFGRNIHPSILDTLSRRGSDSADYFFLASVRRELMEKDFLTTYIPQANRNSLGLKILALYGNRFSVPTEVLNNQNIREFASTLTSYPGDEIKFINYEGNKYLAMGFEGRYVKDYKLIGLYPLDNIDQIIEHQRQQLIVFAILSLLMTLALSQVLSQNFLVPLRLLTKGAHAIENKVFKHRLPDLGADEFGAMGNIFNDVMVELEELSVAGAIQEQLLPQQQIETGFFSLYGRSIAMGELGGDYYDYIQIADDKFSVLLGDVAGHGVGAALIMAMAKAGIIQSDNLLDQPCALLNRLHGLIYASKTKKQKKIMTFQYLCIDSYSGKATYSNAGACSPMIIRKNRDLAEELTLAGAALGAFKKTNYSEIDIAFEPGDAIVFYTDGIVEARNSVGDEIGYDNLKKLFNSCWNENAEIFYNNIYQSYMQHLDGEEAQDDFTVVILVFTGKKQKEVDSADDTT